MGLSKKHLKLAKAIRREDEQLQAYNLKPSTILVRDATRAVRAGVAAISNENLDGAMKWAVRALRRLEVLEARYPVSGERP
jgi:hypothetical protein